MPYTMPSEVAWCTATLLFPTRKLLEDSFDDGEGKSYTYVVVYMSPGSRDLVTRGWCHWAHPGYHAVAAACQHSSRLDGRPLAGKHLTSRYRVLPCTSTSLLPALRRPGSPRWPPGGSRPVTHWHAQAHGPLLRVLGQPTSGSCCLRLARHTMLRFSRRWDGGSRLPVQPSHDAASVRLLCTKGEVNWLIGRSSVPTPILSEQLERRLAPSIATAAMAQLTSLLKPIQAPSGILERLGRRANDVLR
jgi:hypothetical protein